jgi:hypothetical protein
MIKKVDLFLHTMLYNTCRKFTKHFAEALERQGVTCRLFDVEDGEMRSHIQTIIADPPDCTVCFTCKDSFEGTLFCELGIPHFSYVLDSSIYFKRLTEKPNLAMAVIDEYDCEYERQYPGFENIFFLPHAVEREASFDHLAERPYDVVMIGALWDYEAMRQAWPRKYSKELVQVMERVIERVLGDSHTYYIFAFLEEVAGRELDVGDISLLEVFQNIESYFRSYDRIELIRSIKDANVHVFGSGLLGEPGWEKYLSGQHNVTLHHKIAFEQSIDIIRKTKIFLNSTPSYKKGGHERVFNGPALGALVLANENIFLPRHFQDREEILYYQPSQRGHVNDLINEYLSDESKRKRVVHQAREKVMQGHTWDHRAAVFLEQMPAFIKKMK